MLPQAVRAAEVRTGVVALGSEMRRGNVQYQHACPLRVIVNRVTEHDGRKGEHKARAGAGPEMAHTAARARVVAALVAAVAEVEESPSIGGRGAVGCLVMYLVTHHNILSRSH